MSMKLFNIHNFAILLFFSILTMGCSNEDSKKKLDPDPEEKFVPSGIYNGVLKITKADATQPIELTDQLVYIDGTSDKSTFKIGVKNFSIGEDDYGDIMMPTVCEKNKTDYFILDGYISELSMGKYTGSTLTLEGKLTDAGLLTFSIDGEIREGESATEKLIVSFEGRKTDIKVKNYLFDFESWRVVNPFNAEVFHYSLPRTTIDGMSWSSTDAEVLRMIGIQYLNEFTVGSNSDRFSGNLSAQVQTVATREGLNSILLPKVYAGYFYLGAFNDAVAHPHDKILLGVPFYEEPLSIKGYYKYLSGGVYFNCPNKEKPAEVIVVNDKKDSFKIEAAIYEVSSWFSNEVLTLKNYNSSPNVVATAIIEGGDTNNEFVEFDVTFRWKEGVVYDKNKKYRLIILATASKEGINYSGAPGSQLRIDQIRISTKQ